MVSACMRPGCIRPGARQECLVKCPGAFCHVCVVANMEITFSLCGKMYNCEGVRVSDGLENLEQLGVGDRFHAKLCRMLEKVQLLQDFERSEIEKLAHYCGAYKACSGTAIFKEGERGNFMCLIVDGRADIMKENKQVATVRAGKSMGEMSILDGFPYSATAVSAVDSILIMFTRRQFEHLCEANPSLALKLYKAISRLMSLRLRQTTGVLVDYL